MSLVSPLTGTVHLAWLSVYVYLTEEGSKLLTHLSAFCLRGRNKDLGMLPLGGSREALKHIRLPDIYLMHTASKKVSQ